MAARLNRQAWDVRGADPGRAIELARRACDIALALDRPRAVARSYYISGACHFQIDSYELARGDLLQALERYEALGEREPQANALNMLGNVHSALGDHHAAYALYLRSLSLRQQLGLSGAEANSWNNIGNANYHLGDYAQALEAHQRSLALKEELGDRSGAAISLNNIGNVHKASGDFESALRYYRQSLTIAEEVGNKYGQAGALGNIGVVLSALNDHRAALEYHMRSLTIEREIARRHGEAESFLQLGRLFLTDPQLSPPAAMGATEGEPALYCLQQSLAIAEDLHASEIKMQVTELLAQFYERQGDLGQAFAYYRQFHTLERTLFNEALSEQTKKLQILHQVETARQDARLQQIEAELARLRNNELQALLQEADRQRAMAEEANRFKTKLLSIAAHDLKNPLNGIAGFSDLLLMQLPEDSPLRELAVRIRQSARRMEYMLNDLLDSTRIESAGLTLKIEPLDLASLAQQVADAYLQPARLKSQTLTVDAADACFVQADWASMWRVLENLISNAIKFSAYSQQIWVAVTRVEGCVRCAVRDEGPGLTEDDMLRAFGRFERLSAAPTGGETSTGLGLAIVKQLVELQGGRVWAESGGAGCGSTFFVELPASEG